MSTHFEVFFRGETEGRLIAWRPENGLFACTAMEARQRHDDLVEAGESDATIDGVVPVVVEVRQVRAETKKLATVDGNGKTSKKQRRMVQRIRSMLISYIDGEDDVTQTGPWSDASTR